MNQPPDGACARAFRLGLSSFAPRAGFSFPEVLFAVAVLGIGFIMVAAIFPVAIMQTQQTLDETIGTATARNGVGYLRGTRYFSANGLPPSKYPGAVVAPLPAPPARVFSFNDGRITPTLNPAPPPPKPPYPTQAELWDSVRENQISVNDPRFAYIPMYQRDENSPFAKIIVIGVRVRGREKYERLADDRRLNPNYVAELEPRPVRLIELTDNTTAGRPDTVTVAPIRQADDAELFASLGAAGANSAVQAAASGAYLIISDDRVVDDTATPYINERGMLNGRVYRLGANLNGYQFELSPELELGGPAENLPKNPGANEPIAFIVGRGYANARNPLQGYGSTNQAIQRYETVVNLK